ncbi:DUF4229 domain-containing protein [Leucobacter viscericola]|uniref:DUF4229 domain-containing protein n=1 Tax=Leucobacter viscericola TaxID=2714935 RepID=UPI001FCBCF2F|nr:DUF4229 domain-containing protein [Leucobacter viscericola]
MSNPRSAWFIYIVLRLLFFVAPFVVLMLLGIWPWLSAVFAALIGVSLSIIFLAKPRAAASESIYDWRNRERTADDIVEDDALDGAEDPAPAAEAAPAEASDGSEVGIDSDTAGDPDAAGDPDVAGDPADANDPAPQDEQGTRA